MLLFFIFYDHCDYSHYNNNNRYNCYFSKHYVVLLSLIDVSIMTCIYFRFV